MCIHEWLGIMHWSNHQQVCSSWAEHVQSTCTRLLFNYTHSLLFYQFLWCQTYHPPCLGSFLFNYTSEAQLGLSAYQIYGVTNSKAGMFLLVEYFSTLVGTIVCITVCRQYRVFYMFLYCVKLLLISANKQTDKNKNGTMYGESCVINLDQSYLP